MPEGAMAIIHLIVGMATGMDRWSYRIISGITITDTCS